MEDLAGEINKKQALIDEFTKANKKPDIEYIIENEIDPK